MVGKTGLSQAGGVGGFQYGGHNYSFACGVLQFLPPVVEG